MPSFEHVFASLAFILVANEIEAMDCTIGQEPDPQTGRYRWLIQEEDPCQCTVIGMGGFNTYVPYRPFNVTYYDTFLISSDPVEIQQWLNCPVVFACSVEEPLGMEDGRIPSGSITASSFWENREDHAPDRARLNTQSWAAAWCNDGSRYPSPWIQVDFNATVTITGLITQGRADAFGQDNTTPVQQWVTEYEVAYSDDGQSWNNVTGADETSTKFPGNTDRNTHVTARFLNALRTRFLRILPTAWNNHCSMRFEVIGCY